jgi:hypothetical protein
MNNFFDLRPRQWNLMISPPQKRLLSAIAYLEHGTNLIVLDCGRKYDPSVVARAARGRQEIIDRIQIQRAFICSEALQLLERTPAGKTSIIILDFLSTFYDGNVNLGTRKFLLEKSLLHFQRLNHSAGLAVSVSPSPLSSDSVSLFDRLLSAAPQILDYSPAENKSSQLGLF